MFLPGESQGRESLVGCIYGVTRSRTRLKRLSSSSSSSSRNPGKKNKKVHFLLGKLDYLLVSLLFLISTFIYLFLVNAFQSIYSDFLIPFPYLVFVKVLYFLHVCSCLLILSSPIFLTFWYIIQEIYQNLFSQSPENILTVRNHMRWHEMKSGHPHSTV